MFESFRMLKKYDNLKLSLESLMLCKNHPKCNMSETAIYENVEYLISKKVNFPIHLPYTATKSRLLSTQPICRKF